MKALIVESMATTNAISDCVGADQAQMVEINGCLRSYVQVTLHNSRVRIESLDVEEDGWIGSNGKKGKQSFLLCSNVKSSNPPLSVLCKAAIFGQAFGSQFKS